MGWAVEASGLLDKDKDYLSTGRIISFTPPDAYLVACASTHAHTVYDCHTALCRLSKKLAALHTT